MRIFGDREGPRKAAPRTASTYVRQDFQGSAWPARIVFMVVGSLVTLGIMAMLGDPEPPTIVPAVVPVAAAVAPVTPEPVVAPAVAIEAATEVAPKVEDVVKTPALVPIKPAGPPMGTLSLTVDPPVAVYLGDKRLGRTPLKADLKPGVHELRFVSRKIHLDTTRKVRVTDGRVSERKLAFGMSELHLEAPEGAKVYLGRRLVGRAPVGVVHVVEGRHKLKIKYRGETLTEWLNVPPSRKVEYKARFVEG